MFIGIYYIYVHELTRGCMCTYIQSHRNLFSLFIMWGPRIKLKHQA